MGRSGVLTQAGLLMGALFCHGLAAASPSPVPTGSPQGEAEPVTSPVRFADRDDIWFVSDFSEGLDKKKIPEGWKLDDKKKPVDISLVEEGGVWAVHFKSDNSAFGLYKKERFDIKDYPYLNWEWKVVELPEGGDFQNPDKDDQAAQVYVSFGSLSFLNKAFVRAVGYYWSSAVPIGMEGQCPTWGKSRVVVLQSGPEKLGQWIREKRNVCEDYVRLFHDQDLSDVSAVRLYTNSQHTKTKSEVYFRNIYFSKD